jgi:hypothetical protein
MAAKATSSDVGRPLTKFGFARPLRIGMLALGIVLLTLALEDVGTRMFFPRLVRVAPDFSPAYLRRELGFMAGEPGDSVFLGDSVLWGYRVKSSEAAVSLLRAKGSQFRNLAFKGSSPPNYFALTRLMLDAHVRPSIVVLEVNQKVLNQLNDSYRKLHPALESLAFDLLSPRDRSLLVPPPPATAWTLFDHALSRIWLPYAMRTDIRESVMVEARAQIVQLTADTFFGDYDSSTLTDQNIGVHFLEETVAAWRHDGVPVFAFISPLNHGLLHEYIDNPEFTRRAGFLRSRLQACGAETADFDRRFRGSDFIDDAHLNPAAQRRLAILLRNSIHSSISVHGSYDRQHNVEGVCNVGLK